MKLKLIKSIKELETDESYLVWMGYDYSPSGWDIGTANLRGVLELQANSQDVVWTEESKVYKLPTVEKY
jgi:hypothetical protein